MDESNLFKNIVEFTRPRTIEGKDKKMGYLWNCICSLWRSTINSKCL